MTRSLFGLTAVLAVLGLAACASTNNTASTTPTTAASSPSAAASPTAQASTVPTTTDPCLLVTASEASQLTGASYSTGKEGTGSSGGKYCWYGAQTLNVFEVFVITAADAATARSDWDQEKAKVEAEIQKATNAPGMTVTVNTSDTSLVGADRAAVGTVNGTYSGHTVDISALYMLKGAVFVGIVDLVVDHPSPTISAMEAQGQIVLGRLP